MRCPRNGSALDARRTRTINGSSSVESESTAPTQPMTRSRSKKPRDSSRHRGSGRPPHRRERLQQGRQELSRLHRGATTGALEDHRHQATRVTARQEAAAAAPTLPTPVATRRLQAQRAHRPRAQERDRPAVIGGDQPRGATATAAPIDTARVDTEQDEKHGEHDALPDEQLEQQQQRRLLRPQFLRHQRQRHRQHRPRQHRPHQSRQRQHLHRRCPPWNLWPHLPPRHQHKEARSASLSPSSSAARTPPSMSSLGWPKLSALLASERSSPTTCAPRSRHSSPHRRLKQ